jgi:hypothetical protein
MTYVDDASDANAARLKALADDIAAQVEALKADYPDARLDSDHSGCRLKLGPIPPREMRAVLMALRKAGILDSKGCER